MTVRRPSGPDDMGLFREAMREVKPLPRAKQRSSKTSPPKISSPKMSVPKTPAKAVPSPTAPTGPVLQPVAPPTPRPRPQPVARPAAQEETPPSMPTLAPGNVGNLGRKEGREFLAGDVPVDARLDLHGMYSRDAQRAINRFLSAELKCGSLCVEIITGTGVGREDGGVLQRGAREWLNASPHRPQILAIAFAPAGRRKGGNEGALRVMLKSGRARLKGTLRRAGKPRKG